MYNFWFFSEPQGQQPLVRERRYPPVAIDFSRSDSAFRGGISRRTAGVRGSVVESRRGPDREFHRISGKAEVMACSAQKKSPE